MRRFLGGVGFILVVLGVAGAGSQSILIPTAMLATGAVMIGVSARWEEKWTKGTEK